MHTNKKNGMSFLMCTVFVLYPSFLFTVRQRIKRELKVPGNSRGAHQEIFSERITKARCKSKVLMNSK